MAHPHSTTLPFETSYHRTILAHPQIATHDWWFFIGSLHTGKLLRPYFQGEWYVRLGGRLTSHDSWLARWPSIMASSNRSCVVVDGQLASDFVELSSETRANGLGEFILGGGFKYLFYFHPYWGTFPF